MNKKMRIEKETRRTKWKKKKKKMKMKSPKEFWEQWARRPLRET